MKLPRDVSGAELARALQRVGYRVTRGSSIARDDPAPRWQAPFLISFMGIRGIVSLAAALAIQPPIGSGEPFPERDRILFLTFCVIAVTLIGQGLLMLRVMNCSDSRSWGAPSVAARPSTNALDAVMRSKPSCGASTPSLPKRICRTESLRHCALTTVSVCNRSTTGSQRRKSISCSRVSRTNSSAGELIGDAGRRIESELDMREAQLISSSLREGDDI